MLSLKNTPFKNDNPYGIVHRGGDEIGTALLLLLHLHSCPAPNWWQLVEIPLYFSVLAVKLIFLARYDVDARLIKGDCENLRISISRTRIIRCWPKLKADMPFFEELWERCQR